MKSRSLTIYWLVIAATLWAAFSRFHLIAALPPQAWVDEAWIALHARKLLQTGQVYVYYKTFWGGMHPFMVHLTALIQAAGFDSLITSRAISTVAGVLTVPLAFACFDELWRGVWPAPRRRLTAAFTALILSNLLYTVVVSRVGYEPALIPVPMLFFVWQMRRAQRTGRWSSWIAAGLVLGLTQYVSHHARFLILLVVTLALHDLVCLRPSAWHGEDSPAVQRRRLIIGLGVCAAAAILVALPLIVFFVREPEWMLARGRAVTAIPRQTGASFLLENLKLILLSFNFGGDVNPRRNLPGRPMFDCIQSAGLWVGIVWSVLRFRRVAPARDLLAWLAIMTLPSIITDEAPQFERMIGAAAPAAALVAIGWVTLWQWVGQWLERLRADGTKAHRLPVRGWPALLLVLVSLGLNTYDYYGRYPTTPGLSAAFTTTPVRLARQLIERARSEPVFVERITEADDVFAFAFLFPGTPVRRLDFRQCLPLAHQRTTRTTYLVISERDPATAATLARTFPSATFTPLQVEEAALMGDATLIEVPPGISAPPPAHTVDARFEPGLTLLGYDWSGPVVKAGESVFLTLYWKVEADFYPELTAFLHIGRGEGGSRLIAQHDGQPCQGLYPTSEWQRGDVIPDGFAVTIPSNSPPGDYPLIVGWYRYPSLERLVLTSADMPLPDNRAVIATLVVSAP